MSDSGVEGPPLVTCPHCGSLVPAGDFCGHCGAHLVTDSRRRAHAFAATPTEHVAHVSIVTTLFPHLPHRRGGPFRLALIGAAALVLLLAALHLFASATAAAVVALPALYLIYLYEVEVYGSEPWLVIGATMVVGAILGFASASIFGGTLAARLITGDLGSAFVIEAVVIPLVGQTLMLAGPLFLFAFRRQLREPLDGLAFGAASALGFTLTSSLTFLWPLLSFDTTGSAVVWAIRLTQAGLLMMLINACTTGVAAASIWLHRWDRRVARRPWYTSLNAALLVAFGTQLLLGLNGWLERDLALDVAVRLVVTLLLLLYLRLVIHEALLVKGAEHEIGPDSTCPECHRIVPTMAFCPHCGASRAAAPKGKTRVVART